MRLSEILAESRRRHVFRSLVAYALVGFGVLQVAEPVIHGLKLPEWTLTVVVVSVVAGFPVVVALAWIFDLTPAGFERTAPMPSRDGLPALRTSRLGGARLGIVLAALAVAGGLPGFAAYLFFFRGAPPAAPGRTPHAAGQPSIAVLPFEDLSPAQDQAYLADGIAEQILNALARVEGLRVVGRTSSFSFRGGGLDLATIASRLRVNTLLEGSVRKDGTRIRITASLVNPSDGTTLWAETFDRELTGIFALQDDIAGAVTGALAVELLPGRGGPSAAGRSGTSEAYREFLLARHLAARNTPEATQQAIAAAEHAISLDPDFAPAWAELAAALFAVADRNAATAEVAKEYSRRALEAAEKAVTLGPGVPDGYSVRGYLRSTLLWDWEGAHSDLEKATRLGPGDALAHLRHAQVLLAVGRDDEGLREAERALDLDPLSVAAWTEVGGDRLRAGDLRGARESFERASAIDPADLVWIPRRLAQLDLLEGRPGAARARFERMPPGWVKLTGLAMALHSLGDRAGSDAALEALVAESADTAALQIAQVHAWRGDAARALEWLERARTQRDTGMRRVLGDPYFAALRSDPRYLAVLEKMRLPAGPAPGR